MLSSLFVACLIGLTSVWLTESASITNQGNQEMDDNEFLQMFTDRDLRSRRRDNPPTDEGYWADENVNNNAEESDQTKKLQNLIEFSTNLKVKISMFGFQYPNVPFRLRKIPRVLLPENYDAALLIYSIYR